MEESRICPQNSLAKPRALPMLSRMRWLQNYLLAGIIDGLAQINHKLNQIMSAISDFAAKMIAHNDAADAAIAGLQTDVADLKAKIEQLQNTPGTVTPEDQALLDAIEARAGGISDKLAALDALTPPVPPT